MHNIRPVKTKQSPRKIIAEHFEPPGNTLPIRGGWGYSKKDACIIDKFDPIVDRSVPFNGISIEYIFVEKRIYEEMIVCRPEGDEFSGIKWELIRQELVTDGDRKFDKLIFEITAIPEKDWEELKAEYEGPNGVESPHFNQEAHEKKRQEKMIRITREFWFDITSFFGQGLIIKDPESGKMVEIKSNTEDDKPTGGSLYGAQELMKNADLLDYKCKQFSVLSLVQIALPIQFNWYYEDYDTENSKAAVFRTWFDVEPKGVENASFFVGDGTDDPTEPDISVVLEADIPDIDNFLEADITRILNINGVQVLKWLPSELVEHHNSKILVTSYIVKEDERERKYLMHRFLLNNRKMVIIGSYDTNLTDMFETPIIETLNSIIPNIPTDNPSNKQAKPFALVIEDHQDMENARKIEQCQKQLGYAIHKTAVHYSKTGRNLMAFQILDKFASFTMCDEDKAFFRMTAGRVAEQEGEFEVAANEYRDGLEHPTSDEETAYFLHNNLGYSLIQLEKYAEAEEYCRKAINIDSTRYNAHKNLGLALKGQGLYMEAAKSLDFASVITEDPRAKKHLEDLLAEHPEIKSSFHPVKIAKEGFMNIHNRSRMVH